MAKKVVLSNTEVTNSLEAIQTLLLANQSLPIGLSTTCYDNMELLSEQDQEVENYRQTLIDEHAEFDSEGEVKTISSDEEGESNEIQFKSEEDREKFVEKLSQKYDETNQLELQTVSKDLIEEVEAPPQVVPALRWMFEEEDE